MKHFIAILACLCAVLPAKSQNQSGSASNNTDNILTITVQSPSITSGDTIWIDRYDLFFSTEIISAWPYVAQQDGKAVILAHINSFSVLNLRIGDNKMTFYADAGQQLDIKFDSPEKLRYATPTGGFYVADIYDYFVTKNNADGLRGDAYDKLNFFLKRGVNDSIQYYLQQYNNLNKNEDLKAERAFNKRTDNQISAYCFAQEWGNTNVDKSFYEKQWKKLDDNVKNTGAGQFFKSILDKRLSLKSNAIAPNFSITDLNGNHISLEDLKGKYVLVYYWGICGYVMQSSPDLIDLNNSFSNNLSVIAITEAQTRSKLKGPFSPADASTMKPFQNLLDQDWISANIDENGNSKIKDDYMMNYTPCVVLISPKGRIIQYGYADVLKTAKVKLLLYNMFHK